MDSGLKYLVLDGVGVAPLADNLYYLGSDSLGFIGLKFPDLKLYQIDANTLSLENLAGGTYKSLVLGVLASGPTNGNTLLLKANDTTFITLTTGATDVCTLNAITMSGTWLVSGAVTLPAFTLGGAITGNSQNITGLGTIAGVSLATSAAIPLLLTNGQLVNIALTAQTVGATTLTIPNFASVVDEFTFQTKSQTMANKTLTAPVINGVVTTTGLTLPAHTLGGTITGNNQSINNLGSIGLSDTATVAGRYINIYSAPQHPGIVYSGLYSAIEYWGNSNNVAALGIYSRVSTACNTSSSANYTALEGVALSSSGQPLTAALGTFGLLGLRVSFTLSGNSNVTSAAGISVSSWGNTVGVITYAVGVYIASPTATNITNAYAIYIDNITGASTLNYAIYSVGGAWYMSGALTVGSNVSWLPTTDQQWSIGSDAKRLLLVRAVTVTSGRHNFDDKFYMEEDTEFLRFHDYQSGILLMKLDREGNLYIKGAVKEFN